MRNFPRAARGGRTDGDDGAIAAVDPLGGLTPWIGGKRNLAARLAARIAAIPHRTYAEPFVGMGGVFFRRREYGFNEVLNDLSGDVVNLFRVVKHHPEAYLEELCLQLFSRREFARLLKTDPATLTDVQRAARFYRLQRSAFAGKPVNRSFAATPLSNRAVNPSVLLRHVRAAHARLARVTIENLPYQEFITRYDRPATLFYLDPPYWGCEGIYGRGLFGRADFAELAGLLEGLKGSFMMSLNDRPEVRRAFRDFTIEAIETTYSAARTGNNRKARELLITSPKRRPRTWFRQNHVARPAKPCGALHILAKPCGALQNLLGVGRAVEKSRAVPVGRHRVDVVLDRALAGGRVVMGFPIFGLAAQVVGGRQRLGPAVVDQARDRGRVGQVPDQLVGDRPVRDREGAQLAPPRLAVGQEVFVEVLVGGGLDLIEAERRPVDLLQVAEPALGDRRAEQQAPGGRRPEVEGLERGADDVQAELDGVDHRASSPCSTRRSSFLLTFSSSFMMRSCTLSRARPVA